MPTTTQPDPFDLQRFLTAQEPTYSQVHDELSAGLKRTHWMWFIFPQIEGLGSSATARRYAITGLAEACAYLTHSILGSRLRACTALVNGTQGRSLDDVFGYPDNLKFYSSMTLFAHAVAFAHSEDPVFSAALQKYFANQPDAATIARLRR